MRRRLVITALLLSIPLATAAPTQTTPVQTPAAATTMQATPALAKPALEWCLHHLPPRHSYLPGQAPSGPMVDMMQELASASGFILTFSPPTPPGRCLKLLEQGKTDLMMGLVFTEQRDAAYFMAPFDEVRMTRLFVAPHSPPLNNIKDLRGLTVAMSQDRTYPAAFFQTLRQQGARVIWGKDLESSLALLLYKQADLYAGPQHFTELELQKNPRFLPLTLNPWQMPADPSQHTHLALSRLSAHRDLWPTIEQQLQLLVAANKTRFY